jgi:glycosyltransferase involved in cell wall biosynthesis
LKDYIIVTPCKNEQENISHLVTSVVNQTIKPKLWTIVDDGSTDSTPEILRNIAAKYSWIYVHTLEKGKRDLSFHYAEVVNNGFNLALNYSERHKIFCDYLGLIDADMILSLDFFEKIMNKFEENSNLGIASGTVMYKKKNEETLEGGRDNLPIGGLRIWRKECFLNTGGFPISYSPDSVSNVLAILNGWDTVRYEDITGIQTRETSSAEGLWKGFKIRGKSDYYRGYHPLYITFKFFKYTYKPPFYLGISYLLGYITGVIKLRTKIENIEVRNYYRNKHKEIIYYYIRKLKFCF